jgi:hypothetical protein
VGDSVGIGSKIWRFDSNRRVYGTDRSRPIWREHWAPYYVVGENRVSWLLAAKLGGDPSWNKVKCPKKRDAGQLRAWAFSEAEIDEQEWDQKHRWKVMQRAERELTTAQVREVAKMIGFDPSREE